MSCRRYKNGKQGDHKRSFKRRTSQRNGNDGCCGDDLKSDDVFRECRRQPFVFDQSGHSAAYERSFPGRRDGKVGGIKPEEAKHHPDKNIITRAIGAKADVEVDFYEHRLKRGDIILMCTDGLSNMVEDEELFHIVQGGRDIVESGQALIEAAKENGGTDNIGVVLIEPFADEVSVL